MLEQLTITDFALARSVVVSPGPRLNIFTGETGAGKSLVVDALTFLFGGRRGREIIATGADRATVAATLLVEGVHVVVERSVTLTGRSVSRIDGQVVTVDEVRQRFGPLVEIHGQSEQLAILRPGAQLLLLDAYAGLNEQRAQVAALVRTLRDVRRQHDALSQDSRGRERLIDQLRYEVAEIESAGLVSGEDTHLREEQNRLANSGRLLESAAAAVAALDEAPIGEVARLVAELDARDTTAAPLVESATSMEAAAGELGRLLRQYAETVEEDPERLAVVQERLDTIARLCRKYGESVDDVLAYHASAAAQLAQLDGADESLEALALRARELLAALTVAVSDLSAARRAHAGDLVRAIARELDHLGMAGATLSVGFACVEDAEGPRLRVPEYEVVITEREAGDAYDELPCAFTETGVDRIEFLASFNPGESPRPLATVASGGETSRFLLALTTVLGKAGTSRLVVLDEVDEGVGGRAGAIVGESLAHLADDRQVLCITHLPQVAAYGDHHFVVAKETDGVQTRSSIRPVDGYQRRDELAAMLGGVSDANRAAADALLEDSRRAVP